MAGVKLTLKNKNSIQTIDLNPLAPDSSIVDTIVHSPLRVYQDKEYEIRIDLGEYSDVTTYLLRLNDDNVRTTLSSDGHLIADFENSCAFRQCYGYVRFQLICRRNSQKYVFESPLLSVMVKKSIRNESVRRMTEYIYRNNSVLLADETSGAQFERGKTDISNKTIEAKLSLLDQIVGILEYNYSYFKINSRFKTIHVESIDYFDKLQYVSSATIQYIAQHPDELRRTITNTGIVIGGHRYQPERTLITQNAISFDTDENRAIMGFIERLSYDVRELCREIRTLILENEFDSFEENEYISSTYYVYISTINELRKMEDRATDYAKRILAVQLAYSRVFNIKSHRLLTMPNPSAVFMSVPQYKQLYDCMNEWLKCADIGLETHNQILGLKRMSDIYEYYVLLKLISFFLSLGYDLVDAKRVVYQFKHMTLYRQTDCNNTYCFRDENVNITLYYQPVIYSNINASDYGIGLYRNNTVVFRLEEGLYYRGEYYAPDYIIKYENKNYNEKRYFVMDAKYSTQIDVKCREVPELAFKYIFSLSPIDLNDKIIGLYIFNGQSDQEQDSAVNVYDCSRNKGMIMPRAEIITLTENSTDNIETHIRLLTNSIGRFL